MRDTPSHVNMVGERSHYFPAKFFVPLHSWTVFIEREKIGKIFSYFLFLKSDHLLSNTLEIIYKVSQSLTVPFTVVEYELSNLKFKWNSRCGHIERMFTYK